MFQEKIENRTIKINTFPTCCQLSTRPSGIFCANVRFPAQLIVTRWAFDGDFCSNRVVPIDAALVICLSCGDFIANRRRCCGPSETMSLRNQCKHRGKGSQMEEKFQTLHFSKWYNQVMMAESIFI